jgi:hypothetical protein
MAEARQDALDAARDAGLETRLLDLPVIGDVVWRDDLRNDRLNFVVDDGTVTRAAVFDAPSADLSIGVHGAAPPSLRLPVPHRFVSLRAGQRSQAGWPGMELRIRHGSVSLRIPAEGCTGHRAEQ